MNAPFAIRLRDKATGQYYAPARAEEPLKASPVYEGASQQPRLVRWTGHYGGPNSALSAGIGSLRSRSRDRRRNDGVADAGIETLVSNLVGTGIKPQFNTKDSGLNKELSELWEEWTDEADAEERLDFYGLQYLAAVAMVEAGDVFIRLRTRRPEDRLPVPLQMQVLEAEYVPSDKTESISGGWIQNGIEFNGIGRRVAYHMHRDHPNDNSRAFDGILLSRIPAQDVVHLAVPRRPGLVRGEPWLARALVKLHDLDQADDAMVLKTKIQNLFTGWVSGSVEGAFAWQGAADAGGLAVAPAEPGAVQQLPAGSTINWNDPPDVGANYEPFMKGQMRRVAASIGILYEQLTGDYSQVNDRMWRAAINEFVRRIEHIQHHIIVYQMCRPIVARWVDTAILSGAIRLPSGVTAKRAAMPKWVPQARPYINPVQDVEAKTAEVRAGFKSREATVSAMGDDVEQIDAETARDREREKRLGLTYDTSAEAKLTAKQIKEEPQNAGPSR